MGKDFLGISVFHHFAQIEEGCFVADAGCLLHAVRDDNNGRLLAEFADQLLDLGRRNRIQGRRRFVHQQDRWLDGHGTGNTQSLLLSAGECIG